MRGLFAEKLTAKVRRDMGALFLRKRQIFHKSANFWELWIFQENAQFTENAQKF